MCLQVDLDMVMGGPALYQPLLFCILRLQWAERMKIKGNTTYPLRLEWNSQSVMQVLCQWELSVPYLQVTIRGRGRVVLAAPAPGLGPPTPAGSVIQFFDGRWGALHCVKVPWEQTQTGTGHLKTFWIYKWSCVRLRLHKRQYIFSIKAIVMRWFEPIPQVLWSCIHFRKGNSSRLCPVISHLVRFNNSR